MSYILVIFMSFHVLDGGAAAQQIKFNDLASCEAAKKQIVSSFSRPYGEGIWGRRSMIAECVGA